MDRSTLENKPHVADRSVRCAARPSAGRRILGGWSSRWRLGRRKWLERRGATLVLTAFLLVVLGGLSALAIDLSWIALVREQLQVAADAAALAGAAQLANGPTRVAAEASLIAAQNPVAGATTEPLIADSELGIWDSVRSRFQPQEVGANAVRVTIRRRVKLFFGAILGAGSVELSATATSLQKPRDIAFVIDLSGSMNDDTEIWATPSLNTAFTGYPGVGTTLLTNVLQDFSFGAYPGTLRHVAEGLPGAPLDNNAYTWLTTTYLFENSQLTEKYRIHASDDAYLRKTKAYSWIIDYQLASWMPQALPFPTSETELDYWSRYLDYIILQNRGLPPGPGPLLLSNSNNPNTASWPTLTTSSYSKYYNKLGYLTYVTFLMDYGRSLIVTGKQYGVLSTAHPLCPWNTDSDPSSPGYGLRFPAREQPTHSVRLALISTLKRLEAANSGRPEYQRDHCSVISFDTIAGTQLRYPLDVKQCDYVAVRDSVRGLQAAADDTLNSATETGLALAQSHLDPATNPGGGRAGVSKYVVLLTDGVPNLRSSTTSAIDAFIASHPSAEWFTSGSNRYERNAVLMRIWLMQQKGWRIFPVGVGLGADRALLDRAARLARTAQVDASNPTGALVSYYATGNPALYPSQLIQTFQAIVDTPELGLVR